MHLRLLARTCAYDLLHPSPRPSEAAKWDLEAQAMDYNVHWGVPVDHSFKTIAYLLFFGFTAI